MASMLHRRLFYKFSPILRPNFNRSCELFHFQVRCLSEVKEGSNKEGGKWHLVSGVCLERKPIITAELTRIEKDFQEMLDKIEFENSLLSDHELRHISDLKHLEKLKKGEKIYEDDDEDASNVRIQATAQDYEDACEEELKSFPLASRITKADQTNDKRSIQRCLDTNLLLVVQQKLGNDYKWILPWDVRKDGETMRQAAERVLKQLCGDDLSVCFMGNAPAGYYQYKYPREDGQFIGAKVFFFKAQLLQNSNIKKVQNESVKDFAWLKRSEWRELLHPSLRRCVSSFMVNYDPIKFRYPRKYRNEVSQDEKSKILSSNVN